VNSVLSEKEWLRQFQINDIPIVYVKDNGMEYVVMVCPYCGGKHFHSRQEGHRVAHCSVSVKGYSMRDYVGKGYVLRLPLIKRLSRRHKGGRV